MMWQPEGILVATVNGQQFAFVAAWGDDTVREGHRVAVLTRG